MVRPSHTGVGIGLDHSIRSRMLDISVEGLDASRPKRITEQLIIVGATYNVLILRKVLGIAGCNRFSMPMASEKAAVLPPLEQIAGLETRLVEDGQ